MTLEFFFVIFIYNRVEQSGRAHFGDTFVFLKKKLIERKTDSEFGDFVAKKVGKYVTD